MTHRGPFQPLLFCDSVGQCWSLTAKWIFPAAFNNKKKNPTRINAEKKKKSFPKALEEGFPASLHFPFPSRDAASAVMFSV